MENCLLKYVGHSKSNASCLFPWKLQQMQRTQEHYLIEQILSYKTLFFSIVTTISYAFLPAMNKILHAALVKICTSGGDHTVHLSLAQTDGSQKAPNPDCTVGGCGRTVQPRWAVFSIIFKLVWGLILLCCKRKVVVFCGLTLKVQTFSLIIITSW